MSEAQNNDSELAAEFAGGHKVTDDQGELLVEPETTTEESAPQDQTTEEESATPEKEPESQAAETQPKATDSEIELAEDESGKRYVPESRFNKVYGEKKQLERELQQARTQAPLPPINPFVPQTTGIPGNVDTRTEQMEVELLQATLPQFNPNSEDYSPALDSLGAQILGANPGITRLEAARRAIKMAKEVAKTEVSIQTEARKVKALQSDQGITSRSTQRPASSQPDFSKMTDKQLEAYLKSTGQW